MGIFDKVSQLFSGRKSVSLVKPVKRKYEKSSVPPLDQASFKDKLIAAETQARSIILEAKDEAMRLRQQTQEEIIRKEELVERKLGAMDERERLLKISEKQSSEKISEIEKIKSEQLQKLERAAHLTRDEAKKLILTAVEEKLQADVAKMIREAEENAREDAEKKAREILVDAMKHGAINYVAEYTISSVKLPDEEMKGRIIGKEGRNIRTFETVTGVDVDLDEEGVIKLSSFDSVRREIARVALERLMKDGRIQPGRIEELVAEVRRDIERIMFEEGKKLCHEVGVFNLPHALIALLGRFKYRFSYGQNMITHTLEETKIGIALAHEVKADVNIVRLGCLLHDIGKIVTEKEGNHIELGVDLLKKHFMPQAVIDCVAQHHEDTPFTSIESVLVYISDAISGGRPGARYEDIEAYVKRLTVLEQIAKAHDGVTDAFAFQAGRELRVIVAPDKVSDAAAIVMSHKIKDEIEEKLTYPGQIRITLIRELRAIDIAK